MSRSEHGPRKKAPATGSRIHQGLVGERALVGTSYLANADLRQEYATEIAPRTTAALTRILGQVFPQPDIPAPLRVLDLGAGTGAAGAAIREYFQPREIELVAVDKVAVGHGVRAADVTDVASVRRASGGGAPFQVLVAAHVLNELFLTAPPGQRLEELTDMIAGWCRFLLAAEGTLILIEPALRDTSRVLLEVRDRLASRGFHIIAPCLFSGPCPALSRPRDWCHDAAPAPLHAPSSTHPSKQRQAHRIDFSYLVLRQTDEAVSDPTLFRVVSDPMPEKGRLRIFACGLAGRHALVRLDRHRNDQNAAFDTLVRGDLVRASRTTFAQDGLRVGPQAEITRVDPRDT